MKYLMLLIPLFLIAANGPDTHRCSWWLRYLGEVEMWEQELIEAREAHDWAKVGELERIIHNLQKRGALEDDK